MTKSRYEGRNKGKGTRRVRVFQKDQHEVLQAYLYILNNNVWCCVILLDGTMFGVDNNKISLYITMQDVFEIIQGN